MLIKKKKVYNGETATTGENGMGDVAKEAKAMPMSVSASLSSLKKAPMIAAKVESVEGKMPSAKTDAMDTGHSEAYKDRIKKRAK